MPPLRESYEEPMTERILAKGFCKGLMRTKHWYQTARRQTTTITAAISPTRFRDSVPHVAVLSLKISLCYKMMKLKAICSLIFHGAFPLISHFIVQIGEHASLFPLCT